MTCRATLHLKVSVFDGQELGGLFLQCDDHSGDGWHTAHLKQESIGIVLRPGLHVVSWATVTPAGAGSE